MRSRSVVAPIVLIVVGFVFLLSNLGWIPRIGQLLITWWPAILIIVGVSMLVERAWWAPPNKYDARKPGEPNE